MSEPVLEWQMPKFSPEEIVDLYVGMAKAVPGPIQVWVRMDAAKLHFLTFIPKSESRDVERTLYEAESIIYRMVGAEYVTFDVYRDSRVDGETSEESRLVLQHA